MREQVVVSTEMCTSPDASVSVVLIIRIPFLKMIRIIQGFGDDVPLQGRAVAAIDRHAFIRTPADAAMIDDEAFASAGTQRIVMPAAMDFSLVLVPVAHPEPEVSDDDIIPGHRHGMIGQADTIARGRLSGDRDIPADAHGRG